MAIFRLILKKRALYKLKIQETIKILKLKKKEFLFIKKIVYGSKNIISRIKL